MGKKKGRAIAFFLAHMGRCRQKNRKKRKLNGGYPWAWGSLSPRNWRGNLILLYVSAHVTNAGGEEEVKSLRHGKFD